MGRGSAGRGGGGGTGRAGGAPNQVPPEVAADVRVEVARVLEAAGVDNFTATNFSDTNIKVEREAGVNDRLTDLLARDNISDKELARLVGAPNDAKVIVENNLFANGVQIRVEHPFYDTQVRSLSIDRQGNLVLNNDVFKASASAPKGVGTRVLAIQVAAAKKLGVDKITLDAEGSPSSLGANGRFPQGALNGYYVWARLGFNTKLNMVQQILLPDNLKQLATLGRPVRDLNDLMIHGGRAGADWWLKNGSEFRGTFDLRGSSRQSQALDLYLAESGIRIPK